MSQLATVGRAGQDALKAVVEGGLKFSGTGWTSSKASRCLYELTGIGLVEAYFQGYLELWLITLCLSREIDVLSKELSSEQSDATFALVHALDGDYEEAQNEKEASDGELQMLWDDPSLPLLKEIQEV